MINKSLNYILNNVISFFEMVKVKKVKIQKLKRLKSKKCFYENVQCVIVKHQILLKSKKVQDY